MRSIRFILALLIGLSLTLAPVSAAMAGPAMSSGMAMEHCDKMQTKAVASKTMASHCDCCEKSNVCRADNCGAQCAKIYGYLPAAAKFAVAVGQDFPRPSPVGVIHRSWPPPSPPPRV